MILHTLNPRKSLNKAFLKVKPGRTEIEKFKANLITLLDRINDTESEEFHKNLVIDFLKKTYYDPAHFINTKGRNDLVIHNGSRADATVGVIIETKKPTNKAEMMSTKKLNTKAFQELVLYYLRERITQKNLEIKYLIATNINEWFLFDAALFDRLFAQNKQLVKQFEDFEAGRLADTRTDFFYKQIAEPFIEALSAEIPCTFFNIQEYQKVLRHAAPGQDHELIALFKIFSPEHLLKLPFANDSNSLDRRFYGELLHIIGLTEVKEGGKKLIQRHKPDERHTGSILENTLIQLESLDKLSRIDKPARFGHTAEERLFSVALELSITWINRILFLKLLEAQLITYHKGDTSQAFLHPGKISSYDDLNSLFFEVLARKHEQRNEDVRKVFEKVPYLNSSLFEPAELEQVALFISNLKSEKTIPIFSQTVLKDQHGKRRIGNLKTIQYLFEFLNAYDFGAEGGEEIQEENKTLINASVLGLIFEKINGYKDGSFFTPGFITMYMCRETIRRAVVQKFNEVKKWNCTTLDELYDKIEDRKEANKIINSIRICDPAVGSGHFLVSALNELIAVKHDLKILQDRHGKRLKEYQIEVVNDELTITDEDGKLFEYNPGSTGSLDAPGEPVEPSALRASESQRVQEAIFHEKQTIIENCLFGVDINPNSVKICRLRLWIELLKNAYYKNGTELETLPNIDINIKCGNSLVSRFGINADLRQALKKSKWTIDGYRVAVSTYRNAQNKEQKREMERLIYEIKSTFSSSIGNYDPRKIKVARLGEQLFKLTGKGQDGFSNMVFEPSETYGKGDEAARRKKEKEIASIEAEIEKLNGEIEETKNNKIYDNAFEWRFEFPEVLNDEGDFMGFDVVIGNPPYIRQEEITELKPHFKAQFELYSGTADVYIFFIEKGFKILKDKGLFTFIMPNKFMQAGYGKPARKFLLAQNLVEIIDFGDLQVFEEATTYPCILTATKEPAQEVFRTAKIHTLDFTRRFHAYVASLRQSLRHDSLGEETWIISNTREQQLLQKIIAKSELMKNYVNGEAKRGVLTGLTEAFMITEDIKEHIIKRDPSSKKWIKPVLRGRDIQKWIAGAEGMWLITTFPALKIDIAKYPGIHEHLLQFGKDRLEQSGEAGARKKTANKWFETQDTIAYWKDFEKPKIMYQVLQVKPCFIYDEKGLYCNNSMWFIPSADKVLLGILNAKMGWWLISKYCTAIQNGYQLIWKYFGQLPIATGQPAVRKQITELVNKILAAKKRNPAADTIALEEQIDALVYQLYDLTPEEIQLIENT